VAIVEYFVSIKTIAMADDPKKKKQDAKRVSQQPWEQAYQKTKAKKASTKKAAKKAAPKKAAQKAAARK
jgi:uncharacterized protein YdeI (BOF family)